MNSRLCSTDDAPALSEFYRQNGNHLQPWEPLREAGCHDISAWEERLKVRQVEQVEGRAAYFLSCVPDSGEIVATCSLTGIARGPFQACYMGYAVARKFEGRGHMRALCEHAIDYAFRTLQLNRIMANFMPRNRRSAKLLHSLGFTEEGLARKYLCINGQWEDHILTSKLNSSGPTQANSPISF